jgi:hypothetical protein
MPAKIANMSFENAAHFEYLGTTAINQNALLEEIKRRLNSGNALPLGPEPSAFLSAVEKRKH